MKLPSLILLFLAAAVANSNAALALNITLNISTNPTSGAYFVLNDGNTLLPDGNLVRIGTFDEVPASDASGAALASAFTEYATTTSGHSAASGANRGMINRSGVAAGAGVSEAAFTGKNVYLWVYNAPTAAAATQWGVYTNAADWKFEASVYYLPVSLSSSVINGAYGAIAGGGAKIIPGTPNKYVLAGIPETSTFSLTALAALGLMHRKRQSA